MAGDPRRKLEVAGGSSGSHARGVTIEGPPPAVSDHDRLGLELHRAVARRLDAEPRLLDLARENLDRWERLGRIHPWYGVRWRRLLSGDLAALRSVLLDPGEEACALRQASPFAGAIEPEERADIVRAVWTARSSST
jgi:hypothetical protein